MRQARTQGCPRQPHPYTCVAMQLADAAYVGDTAEVCRLVAAGADVRVSCCARTPAPRSAVWPPAPRTAAARHASSSPEVRLFRRVAALRLWTQHTAATRARSPSSCDWARIRTRRTRHGLPRAAPPCADIETVPALADLLYSTATPRSCAPLVVATPPRPLSLFD